MHLYRFTVCEAQELPRLPLVELELDRLPRRGHWPVNWEWRFTFADVLRELRQDLRYRLSRLMLWWLRRLGVQLHAPANTYTHYQELRITDEELKDALWRKLTEDQRRTLLKPERLILVGPDGMTALYKLPREEVFWIELHAHEAKPAGRAYGLQPDYELTFYHYKIPVLYLPDFQGIAVIPDLTGTAERIREDDRYRPLPQF